MKPGFQAVGGKRAALGAVGMTLVLAGCGNTASVPPASTVKLPAIQLVSSVLPASHKLPNKYACNPKIGVPPLKWGALPANTAGLALVVFFVSSQGSGGGPQAAVTGLSPKLHAFKAGVVPHGAVIASDSRVMCPTKGVNATYFVRLYALKKRVKLTSGATVAAAINAIAPVAVAVGSLEVHYKRT
jgi:hypothetical protein